MHHRSSPLLLCFAVVVTGSVALAGPGDGPPYCDPDRNLNEQGDAARDAKKAVKGGAGPEEVARYFADPSAQVRDAAFFAAVERGDGALVDGLLPQLRNPNPFVSAAVAELCAQREHAPAREALEEYGLEHPRELTALEAIWALEALADPASADALVEAFDDRREYRVKGDALIALAACAPEAARELIEEDALDHKMPPVRIAALVALRRVDWPTAVAAARDVIADGELRRRARSWEPRLLLAALETIRRWPDRTADLASPVVEALIARLEREEGRPRHEVGLTLADLTGAGPLGDDPEVWEGWWRARKDGFEPAPPASNEEGEEALPDGERPRPETGDEGGTRVRFHGIPVHSTRLVFAQDISGGMNNPLDEDSGPSKMEFSKDELVRVLGLLDDDVAANVVFFATEYYAAPVNDRVPDEIQLFPLGRARRQLVDFVRRQETPDIGAAQNRHKSRSNLYDTLAFIAQDPIVDTVFFLSEGGPNEGRWVGFDPTKAHRRPRQDRFLRHLERLNVYTRVKVHALQVADQETGARFLRRLAAMTGGQFYDLDFLRSAPR